MPATKPRRPKAITAAWRKVLLALPGYDPFKGSEGCWFDADAAARALDFFAEMLVHIEGDVAGKPFALEPWQRAIVANLFGWKKRDRHGREVRRYRELFVYVPRKNGKALDVETPIPTPVGWSKMGDLKAGDVVFDHAGQPTRVLAAFDPMYDRPCYRVRFSDGTSIVADAEHLWETEARAGGPAVRSTDDIRRTLSCGPGGRVEWNHRIAVAAPLACPAAALPVDPYVLGVWLGDGDSDSGRITNAAADDELLDHVRTAGVTAVVQRADPRSDARRVVLGRAGKNHSGSFQASLRRLGVLRNKHVPPEYLRGSVGQRSAILQGLMDTDGYASKAGQCEFITTSPQLLDGFLELARSLGYKPSVKTARATIAGRDCGEKFRVQFWAYSDRPCFRLARKAARLKPPPAAITRAGTRQIVAVDPVESRPVRCIAVENPRRLYLAGKGMVATHNTPLCAGIGLFMFFCDAEVGAQGFIAAKDREQAGLLFRQMQHMVQANPHLERRCKIYGGSAQAGQSRSFVKPDASFLKIISGDGGGKHGGNPHLVIIDELHEQDNRELIDALTTSMTSANRSQSLFISLTTADHDRPSVCNEKYEWAKKVRDDPAKDPAFLPVLFEADPRDDPHAEATWERCNPNLDVSVSRDELRRLSDRAKDEPTFKVEFQRLHLNIRTRSHVPNAIDLALWDACREDFDPDDLLGRPCWGGLDFGWRDDFAALDLSFPMDDGTVRGLSWFWLPRDGRRDKRDMPVRGFIDAGHVTLTDGNATDMESIYETLREARRKYDVRKVAVDLNNARAQGQVLMAEGFSVLEVVQNKRNYTEPWQWLMAHGLKDRKFRHDGNPVLRWMAGNCAAEVNGVGQVMPAKKLSAEKIDGICAKCMGLGAWLTDGDKGESVYEGRGFYEVGPGGDEPRPPADDVARWFGSDTGDD